MTIVATPEDLGLDFLADESEAPCGHRRAVGAGMICSRGAHPENPDGHVYVADNGSHVPDRHEGAS